MFVQIEAMEKYGFFYYDFKKGMDYKVANVIFKAGTKDKFLALEQKDVSTLYWLSDTQELYKGDVLYGIGTTATSELAGLMSASDKIKLDSLIAGSVAGLTPVDATIIIGDSGDDGKTIGVQVSKELGNLIQVKSDGLFIGATGGDGASYVIEKQSEATEGFSATYKLKKTVGGDSTYIGDEINIPKDMFVQSGSVGTVTEAGQPYAGAQIGDVYIDLVLNDADSSHIYIPAKDLVDTTNFVVGNMVDTGKGTTKIFNEASSGGAMYATNDGIQAFVGVNNGESDGLMAQIYADKQVEGQWVGSHINVYHDHIYYVSLANKTDGKKNSDALCEIATVGDVSKVQAAVDSLSESLAWGSL